MKVMTSLLFLAVSCIGTGCKKPAEVYSVSFRSSSDEVLATGAIEFAAPRLVEGKATGSFTLKLLQVPRVKEEVVWFYRMMEKRERGEVEWTSRPDQPDDWQNTFNFMPGVADANIMARAPAFAEGKTTGTWMYATCAGGYDGGKIQLERE